LESGSTQPRRQERRRKSRRLRPCTASRRRRRSRARREKAGDLSEADVKALSEFMDEARKADAGGDKPACEKALADVHRVLGK